MTVASINKLDLVDIAGSLISQITQQNWDSGIETILQRGGGHVHPMASFQARQKPVISFSTPQIDDLCVTAAVGLEGLVISATPALTYFKKGAGTGSVARATAQHIRMAVNAGFVHWGTISLPDGGEGSVDAIISASYDGTNEPIVPTGSIALPSNLVVDKMMGAGPVTINGTVINGITNISIESGVNLIVLGDASEVWPTLIFLESTAPAIVIDTLDATVWTTFGADGTALNGTTGVVCYAKKFTKNQAGDLARVANGVAEHVKFIGLRGTVKPMNTSGQGTSPLTTQLRCDLTALNDTTNPLAITLAAIT